MNYRTLLHNKNGKLYFDKNLLASIQRRHNTAVRITLHKINLCYLVDNTGTTLLHYAADYGNVTILKYLIGRGCNIDAADNLGNTTLIIAAEAYHIDVIHILLEAKASVLITNKAGNCAAKLVIGNLRVRNADILHKFVKRVKEECLNDSQLTAKKLMKFKCPLNRVVFLNDAAVTKFMLDSGCNVNDRDKCGTRWTALHQAVASSDLENVKLLIERGADVNIQDRIVDKTPLYYYRTSADESDEQIEILKLLLDNGASLDASSSDGESVAQTFFIRAQKRAIRTLLPYVDLRNISQAGFSLISYIVFNPNIGVIEELSRHDFDVNVKNNDGSTILSVAVKFSRVDVVEFLLKNGADVNPTNDSEIAALFSVFNLRRNAQISQKDQLKCIELLLQYGVDVQYSAKGEMTVFNFAMKNKYFNLIKPVLAHLALIETLGKEIKVLIVKIIDSNDMFQKYFNFCKRKIDLMKRTVIYGTATLFKLLTENDVKIRNYMRDEKLALKVASMIYSKRNSKFYYYNVLRKRMVKAIENAQLRKTAVEVVLTIDGLDNNLIVAEKIVDYLNQHDLKKYQ